MTTPIDFVVIGGGDTAYCAAAVAASLGARATLIDIDQDAGLPVAGAHASSGSVPNSLWRRLNLQNYGLALEPTPAFTTLLPKGRMVSTYQNDSQTEQLLAELCNGDHAYWRDFLADMRNLEDCSAFRKLTGFNGATHKPSNGNGNGSPSIPDSKLFGDAASFLEDYFSHKDLITHLLAQVMAQNGMGAATTGSALALPGFFLEEAWPQQPSPGGAPLIEVLRQACETLEVEIISSAVVEIGARTRKRRSIVLSNGDSLDASIVYFASPNDAASLGVAAGASPLHAAPLRTAQLRITLSDSIAVPGGEDGAMFQIADSIDEIQEAFEAASLGRLPVRLPVGFQMIDENTIVATTHYCPRTLCEDGVSREWTSQDKQALTSAIISRLDSRLPGISEKTSERQLSLSANTPIETPISVFDHDGVIVQPHRHDGIAVAEDLVEWALSHG